MSGKNLKALLHDDGFLEKHIFSDPYIMSKIKAELLRQIMDIQPPATIKGGGVQIRTPVHKPKDLQEAAQMTQKYLSK